MAVRAQRESDQVYEICTLCQTHNLHLGIKYPACQHTNRAYHIGADDKLYMSGFRTHIRGTKTRHIE